MKTIRLTEEQAACAPKPAQTGVQVGAARRRMGISERTFYGWKRLANGLGTGTTRRPKQPGDENRTFRPVAADLSRDRAYPAGQARKTSSDARSALLRRAPDARFVRPASC